MPDYAARSLRLESEEINPCNLRPMLRVTGSTLETFELVDGRNLGYGALNMADLLLLRTICPRQYRILIYIKDCDDSAYVDFLGSYGAQLRCATFWGMSKDACQQVMAHCPNIRASFYLHTTNNLDYQHAVPVLAPALTELLHVNAEEPLRRYDLENATRACAAVERIELRGSAQAITDAVKALFLYEKMELKSFLLDVWAWDNLEVS